MLATDQIIMCNVIGVTHKELETQTVFCSSVGLFGIFHFIVLVSQSTNVLFWFTIISLISNKQLNQWDSL